METSAKISNQQNFKKKTIIFYSMILRKVTAPDSKQFNIQEITNNTQMT